MSAKGSEDQAENAFENLSMEVSRERVENLWRQVMTNRSSARADLAAARAARAKAEMEKQRVSNETMEATQRACDDIIAEAEQQVTKAKEATASAAAMMAAAQEELKKAEAVRAEADAQSQKVQTEAESYAEKVKAEAQQLRDDS